MNRTHQILIVFSLLAIAVSARAEPLVEVLDSGAEPRSVLRYRPEQGLAESLVVRVSRGSAGTGTPEIAVPLSVEVSQVLSDGGYVLVLRFGTPRAAEGATGAWTGLDGTTVTRLASDRGIIRKDRIVFGDGSSSGPTSEASALARLVAGLAAPLPEAPVGAGALWTCGETASGAEATEEWRLGGSAETAWVLVRSADGASVQLDPGVPFPARAGAPFEVVSPATAEEVEPVVVEYFARIAPATAVKPGVTSQGVAPGAQGPGVPQDAAAYAGRYREFWAEGQETDVEYHDEYEVVVSRDGTPAVDTDDPEQTVESVRFTPRGLEIAVRTTFIVTYRLNRGEDGHLRGTATTPEGEFPIRWEPLPAWGMAPADAAEYAGSYVEYWAEGQDTDVTYHDEYEIRVTETGGVPMVIAADEKEEISGVRWVSGGLGFTVRTTFDVVYRLKRSEDGDLRGTATTPEKVVPIRWARAEAGGAGHEGDAPPPDAAEYAGHYREFWAEGQETDVAYHDEYEISVSTSGAPVVTAVDEKQAVVGAGWAGGGLTVTIRTSFEVVYRLRRGEDGDLRGTATTPEKIVPVRWGRVSGK